MTEVLQPFQWQEKVWGETTCLVKSELYSYHKLKVNAGGFCSFHYHRERANRFVVNEGSVRVVWSFGFELHKKLLTAGNMLDIPSLVPHQFQVVESGEMVEEYWPDRGGVVQESDIVRLTQGGIDLGVVMPAQKPVIWLDGPAGPVPRAWDGGLTNYER